MAAEIVIFGDPDVRTREQLDRCAADHATHGVLCADAHVGYSMPIGGVVAYPEHVSPSGVGYDIACGNKAVLTNLRVDEIVADLPALMDQIVHRISFGIGRVNNEPVDHSVIGEIEHADYPWQRGLLELAEAQLGTIGAGNHYVDLLADEVGRVWVGVHFGSRGFGHKTATHFLKAAGARNGMDEPPCLIPSGSDLGQAYIAAMEQAGRYAYAGRDLVCQKVLEILGASEVDSVHNHHNFAWWEEHDGQNVWVIRKGATPAWPGQRGFVGGSMGSPSYILEGEDSPLAADALYSTVHGAGRRMSRSQAAGKLKRRAVWSCQNRDCDGTLPIATPDPKTCPRCGGSQFGRWQTREIVNPGLVDWPVVQERLRADGVELRGGAADEAPEAYKDIKDVIGAHAGTIRVMEILRPLGVAMAGSDTVDPFKD